MGDFNNSTGEIINTDEIGKFTPSFYAMAVEFSPCSDKLYLGNYNDVDYNSSKWQEIWQFDLTAGTPNQIDCTATLIARFSGGIQMKPFPQGEHCYGALIKSMNLAPNGKIYTISDWIPYISVINNPQEFGNNVQYIDSAIQLYSRNSICDYMYVHRFANSMSSYFNIDVKLNGTKQVCIGDSIIISSNIPERFSNPDYFWTGPSGFTSKEPYIIIPKADYSNSGSYKLTVMNEGLCGWDTISVAVGVGEVKIEGMRQFCSGDSTILKVKPESYKYNYLWNTGDTTSSIKVKTAGTYTVRVSNDLGCIDYDTVRVIAFPKPNVKIIGDNVACLGESSVLTAVSTSSEDSTF